MLISRTEYLTMKHRIEELEEILCPCGQHDWVEGEKEYARFNLSGEDNGYTITCKCKRCKRKKVKVVRE